MGFLSDIFKKTKPKIKFRKVPQTEQATEARERLFGLATGEPPAVPRREIAPIKPLGEERQLARTTAKEMIQPQDFFSLPEVQGIIQEARTTGDLLTNRISRALQASGNITSTTGRDALGRAVTEIQKSLASSLAPFAMEERGRRREMIPLLESLGLTEEERGRITSQADLDALFSQQMTQAGQLQDFTIPLLESIIGLQPGQVSYVRPGKKSVFEQYIMPGLGAALGGALSGGGGAGQTGVNMPADVRRALGI